MAKVLRRRKVAPIYDTANKWHENSGGVSYVAHAILSDGTIKQLANPTQTEKTDGSSTKGHPDQRFWANRKVDEALKPIVNKLARIEVDCSLMPCDGQNGCLTVVPQLIAASLKIAGTDKDVPLRIFSHRSETPGGDKQYFDTSTKAGTKVQSQFKDRGSWTWQSPENAKPDGNTSVDYQAYVKDLVPI
jgi:hypothetical protein